MALLALLEGTSPAALVVTASCIALLALALYRAYLSPLSAVPGPLICRITSLWIYWRSYVGDECSYIDNLHARYGPVVRIAPNEVCISDGNALAPIYSEKGGMLKAPAYKNFDFNGHATIFSAIDPAHRAVRSKAVLPLFSTASIRNGNDAIEGCVNKFVERLKDEAEESRRAKKETGHSKAVNVLNISRGLALDAISTYLFGKSFGGVDEKTEKMSASGYVDSIVGIGSIIWLPSSVFHSIKIVHNWLYPSKEAHISAEKVSSYVQDVMEKPDNDGVYQARLKKAGISKSEVQTQLEDAIFAGTDSTGMNISMICWYLAKHPNSYSILLEEVRSSDANDPTVNPQILSYLDAVVRETLRLAMANPVRLPRVVPPSGWQFEDYTGKRYHFPAGTLVAAQILTMHTNPKVFPDPLAFRPERWLDNPTKEMQRDWMPFSLGQRQCIARNLAMQELCLVTRAIARENVLAGAKAVSEDKVEILEWFNSKVVGERIDVAFE